MPIADSRLSLVQELTSDNFLALLGSPVLKLSRLPRAGESLRAELRMRELGLPEGFEQGGDRAHCTCTRPPVSSKPAVPVL